MVKLKLSEITIGILAETVAQSGETVEKVIEHIVNEADFEQFVAGKRERN